jgi:hypothetical protein
MMTHNALYVIEQSPLRWMIKTLPFADCAKGLAWKTSQQNIKSGDLRFRNLGNVAMRDLVKVRGVRLL